MNDNTALERDARPWCQRATQPPRPTLGNLWSCYLSLHDHVGASRRQHPPQAWVEELIHRASLPNCRNRLYEGSDCDGAEIKLPSTLSPADSVVCAQRPA